MDVLAAGNFQPRARGSGACWLNVLVYRKRPAKGQRVVLEGLQVLRCRKIQSRARGTLFV
eukprot:10500571-Lingulodinium_polyedra.AAC.1